MNKTIKINPNLLLVKPKKEKKDKTAKNVTKKNLDELKKHLIKSVQKPNQQTNVVSESSSVLKDSMNFLSTMNTKKKKSWVDVNLDNPSDLFGSEIMPDDNKPLQLKAENKTTLKANDIPYGCLKNGKKPTYRNYQKHILNETRKNNHTLIESLENVRDKRLQHLKQQSNQQKQKQNQQQQQLLIQDPILEIDIDAAVKEDLELNTKLKRETAVIDELKISDHKKTTLVHKTVVKTYTLGKVADKRIVNVLIKNAERKNEILNAKEELRRTKLNSAKQYLIERKLLKKGSDAPTNLIMEMFKNARLTGDIYNINFNSLLESFVTLDD
jgi:hypothetical protein